MISSTSAFRSRILFSPVVRRVKFNTFKIYGTTTAVTTVRGFNTDQQHGPEVKFTQVSCNDTEFRVGYSDDGARDGATVLALHGISGSTSDFSPLFDHIISAGHRFITLNFPGYGITKPGLSSRKGGYDESCTAKTQFVRKCLDNLQIDKIDCLIAHSGAAHTALSLAAKTDSVGSLALLSPIGIRPHRAMRPALFTRAYSNVLENKLMKPAAILPLKFAFRLKGFTQVDDPDLLTVGTLMASRLDFEQAKKDCEALSAKRTPFFVVTSEKDRIVEHQLCLETARLCGLPDTHISRYCTEGHPTDQERHGNTEFPRALVFNGGGHFIQKKYHQIIGKIINELIDQSTVKP